jgi:uncharacterized LabA/DUF88 family protein
VGKNVAVFVDVANIFYAAKAAGVDIDYVTLLKASSAGRDLVRAYAYTGLDPDNENQRNFHDFLRRHGYRVVSKDIRKYGDGKVKANLDIELVIDMMKTARNLDVAIVVSGDGDFAPAIRAVQEMGVRVEVVSFRGNTSSDLMDVADQFTDITQIAKVEKGSSRSGRRVADDDQDLSMTEVPEKQSEGPGERSRGRGRTRRTTTVTTTASRARGRAAVSEGAEAPIVVLPGEKLSRVAAVAAEPAASDVDLDETAQVEADAEAPLGGEQAAEDAAGEEARRRRRRRGGRGRGRGRGREEGAFADEPVAAAGRTTAGGQDEEETEDEAPAPARRPASAFGSVWDSQIGIGPALSSPIVSDDEDFEEPSVPEYLIAERRQRDSRRGGGGGGGRPGRGRGGAYAAALDRERFGGGRGSTPSRFAEPAPRGGTPAFGRDDRRDRERGDRPPFRQAPRPAPRGSGDEPWSEVPPEIEAMLRAQLGTRPAPAPAPRRDEPAMSEAEAAPAVADATAAPTGRPPRRTGRKPAAGVAAGEVEASAPKSATTARRAPARRSRTTAAEASSDNTTSTAARGELEPAATPAPASSRRRTATRTASTPTSRAASAAAEGDATTGAATEAPKRRPTRRKAEPAG